VAAVHKIVMQTLRWMMVTLLKDFMVCIYRLRYDVVVQVQFSREVGGVWGAVLLSTLAENVLCREI
jgi:hypothetical protein